ncbi:16S rRNA (cytosine(1402)-N(4))-methyltransferase RsmH [uncultured Finegoldia sp.]|uniref:16S rRNA (cytosine(1402)-N(4))-methyltransferase RsmH n=1 Tax=uncultured Finegoldia sp. TaxID=328009 RepID=UPI00262BCBA8|nr:16S rRNA (cytosine(1402)-N(4))-methyltransferase RsmH [uncultured Finegoldia sp.]
MEFKHVPILLDECIENLNIRPGKIYVDCTVGGAGHSREIVKKIEDGKLICFDQDETALNVAKKRLEDYSDRVVFIKDNFKNIKKDLQNIGIEKVDGILMDIGVSSYQIDEDKRGFSYMHDAQLDMRMDQSNPISAKDIVNTYSKEDLENIIFKYSDEKWAKRIAEFICKEREIKPIETTFELVEVIEKAIPKKVRMNQKGHSSKKTFQAIRIEVNKELDVLEKAVGDCIDLLNLGGRICIITFHSLEDKICKEIFKDRQRGCICPPEIPVCVCNHKPEIKILTRKPIEPSKEELKQNSRARSAKLRVAEKII